MEETSILSKLLSTGGKVLIIGGGLSSLPDKYKNHPRFIIWDDEVNGIASREIPSNVRGIIYTRFVSHKTLDKINKACKNLRIIKFPMLRNREIKTLLDEVIQPKPELKKEEETTTMTPIPTTMSTISAAKRETLKSGILKQFITEHLDWNRDYTVRGSIKEESERLLNIANERALKTTLGSISVAVGSMVKGNSNKSEFKSKPERQAKSKPQTKDDPFLELERLIGDAIAAMNLVQEQISVIRKTEESRMTQMMKDKLLSMFSGS